MTDFVLVHGSWMGAWAWERVLPLLTAAGHGAGAIDLPGYGSGATRWRRSRCRRTPRRCWPRSTPLPSPWCWSGFGGRDRHLDCRRAAPREDRPPGPCRRVHAARRTFAVRVLPEQPGVRSKPGDGLREIDQDAGTSQTKPEGVGAMFVNDGTPQDVEFARANGNLDFLRPSGTPIAISPENWGRVPRLHVETLRDQAVPVTAQRRMNELLPGADLHTTDTGHSPFITQPRQLADLLAHATSSAAAAH